MITKYKKAGLVYGIPGLLLQPGCMAFHEIALATSASHPAAVSPPMLYLPMAGSLLGLLLLLAGLRHFAKAKGYGEIYGLLGFFSILGVVILLVLPDKTKA